jgi:hypothetical protein
LAITMRLYVVGKDRTKEKRWDCENRRSNCFRQGEHFKQKKRFFGTKKAKKMDENVSFYSVLTIAQR